MKKLITGTVTIPKESDKRFRNLCDAFLVRYYEISSTSESSRYQLNAHDLVDVFTVGKILGIWAIQDEKEYRQAQEEYFKQYESELELRHKAE